jgi:hypothetical protein
MITIPTIRKQFYLDIVERLKLIIGPDRRQIIKTFDLWNEQWKFLDQIPAFSFPAIFIEFKSLPWTQLGKRRQATDGIICVHIGSYTLAETKDGSSNQQKGLDHLVLLDAIHYILSGWDGNGDYFGAMTRMLSEFDHNHNAVVADVETFKTRMVDDSAVHAHQDLTGVTLKIKIPITEYLTIDNGVITIDSTVVTLDRTKD